MRFLIQTLAQIRFFVLAFCIDKCVSCHLAFRALIFQRCRHKHRCRLAWFYLALISLTGCASSSSSGQSLSRWLEQQNDVRNSVNRELGNADINQQQSLIREMLDWQMLSNDSGLINDWAAPVVPYPIRRNPHLKQEISAQLIAAPVEQVLHALARSAELKLELRQPITGTVTLLAENQPLDELLKQVSMQVPIAWELQDDVLQLWGNAPYTESYAVDYLNMDRSTRSSVGLATQVGTINSIGDQGGGGTSNSSQTSLENKADHFFWDSLDTDLKGLFSQSHSPTKVSHTINRDAGLVTVHAPRQLHNRLERYLGKLNDSAQRQVLIEATVVEVALSKKFEAGIDWQFLSENASGLSAAQILSGSPEVNSDSISRITAPNGLMSLVQPGKFGTLSGTLNLLNRFGDVRILSKPRIIALNNQTSVLKVVDNRVYFTVNVERQRSETKDEILTETQIHTVPVGLVMNVTPHIDNTGEVMLNVRPTLSRILGFVDDPNPELASADVRNSVPEIQVREMESMLRVKSGDMAIIGGLMQDVQNGADRSLPGLAALPVVGALFQQRSRVREQTELLIVLKPTVLPAASKTQLAYH